MKVKEKTTGCICEIELKKWGHKKIVYYINMILCVFIAATVLIPLLWICLSSFKDTKEFLQIPMSLFPERIDLRKVGYVLRETRLDNSLVMTLVLSAGCVVADLIASGLGGYALSKLKPAGHSAVLKAVFLTILMPTTMNAVPLFMFFNDLPFLHISLKDTYWPMWMMAGANAFNILLVKSFFDGIPKAYVEAARIDGATDLNIFFRIMLPLSLPLVALIAVFAFNGSWGQFLWPYLMIKNSDLMPLGERIYILKDNLAVDEYMMALIIMILPVMIVFAIFQKSIMKGMSLGGIKG